jgi:uncharacterized protein
MRPILCCRWIQTIGGQPPLQLQKLTAALEMPTEAKTAIERLIERKRAGYELDSVGRIPILDRYISETLPQIKEFLVTLPKPEQVPFELLDPLFHQAISHCSPPALKRESKIHTTSSDAELTAFQPSLELF